MTPCDACEDQLIKGVITPMATNGDDSRRWIERCDNCAVFDGDTEAAAEYSFQTGAPIAWAVPFGCLSPHPYVAT